MIITRCTEWMSGRWWAALAVALAFILVARTGTVGAPAEARTEAASSPASARFAAADGLRPVSPAAAAEARIRMLERELSEANVRIELEKSRCALLRENHDRLGGQLARIHDRIEREALAQLLLEDAAAVPASTARERRVEDPTPGAPVPIEAIFTRPTDQ